MFATAEFQDKVTLWSVGGRTRLTQIRTVLDFGAKRLVVLQEQGFGLLSAANFYGPVNAYDLEGNVIWSRKDLVGVQQLAAIPSQRELMIGVGSDGQPYRILSALDGKEITKLDGIKEVYASSTTPLILAITAQRSICLTELRLTEVHSTTIWKRPLESFAVLHGCLSSKEVAYSEAGGAVYCLDMRGKQKWVVNPEKNRHFLRLAWNQVAARWMAIDWDYARGGAKRLLEISETGVVRLVTDLGEPAESEFFATGERLVTSNGDILDISSGQVVWNYLEKGQTESLSK